MKKISLALALCLLLLAGCSNAGPAPAASASATSAAGSPAASASTPTPTPTSVPIGPLGAAGCHPASPMDNSSVGPEVEGTSNTSLWALLQSTSGVPVKAGTLVKIVWRMIVSSGDFQVIAIGPQGQRLPPDQGPEAHGGSNWNRPGGEWGTVFNSLPVAGCWDFHATAGDAAGDVWLVVVK